MAVLSTAGKEAIKKFVNAKTLWPFALTAVYGVTLLFFARQLLFHTTFPRFVFDYHDISVYFKSSLWVVTGETLYTGVSSEYPLLANIVFGILRLIAEELAGWGFLWQEPLVWFRWLWMLCAFFLFVKCGQVIYRSAGKWGLAIWVAPSPIYFSLLRYDIYPALAMILALYLVSRGRIYYASLALGFCIALKGYALFAVPAFAMFLFLNFGLRETIKNLSLCALPFIASHVVVFVWGGWEAVTYPYQFHLGRGLNRESSYDVVRYLVGFVTGREWTQEAFQLALPVNAISKFFAVTFALLPALLRPKNLEGLADSFLIAIVGFTLSSPFYSPQYVLWIISIAVFSRSKAVIVLAILSGWVTYLHFPIANDLAHIYQTPFRLTVISVNLIHASILIGAIYSLYRKRDGVQERDVVQTLNTQ